MTTAEKNYQDFLELSAWLTASSSVHTLQDQGSHNFGVLIEQVGRDLTVELLAVYRSCRAQSAADGNLGRRIAERLLSDPKFGPMTKNIRRLWERSEWQALPAFWVERYLPTGWSEPDRAAGEEERVVVR